MKEMPGGFLLQLALVSVGQSSFGDSMKSQQGPIFQHHHWLTLDICCFL